jgi:DNA-binding beta-propeller fold protein YncE
MKSPHAARRRHSGLLLIAVLAMSQIRLEAVAPPSNPRVEYLRTVPSVSEFTKPHGFFSRIITWLAGAADDKPELLRPYATTLDSADRLLVADPGQHGIHIYDFEKQKYQFLKGPRGKALESPIDVACDVNDDIYVTDSVLKQIYVFDSRGRFLRTIGGATPDGRLERPTGMAIDRAARRIYVTDTLRHQLLVFGMDGSLIRVIGKRGPGPGEFNFPTAVTLSGGRVYVVDAMNFRVQAFTPDGQFVNTFGQLGIQTGTLNRPKGIAADTDGNLYIVDALFETVQVFDPVGRLLYYFGRSGTGPGQFQLPSGISIDSRNRIYVADSQNRRVQIFQYRKAGE